MPSSIRACCPNPTCNRSGLVPAHYRGRKVRCPQCGQTFPVAAEEQPPETSESARATTDEPAQVQTVDWFLTPSVLEGPGVQAAPAPRPVVPERIGRFVIRAQLGSGAFGTVYRAYDPQLDREIALKVPRPEQIQTPQQVERFLREARAAARLLHPHIVPIHEAGQADGQSYIASALIAGQTLADCCDGGPVECRRAARIVGKIAEALACAHRSGIVHRDVKPANILVDDRDQPYLSDFGLAHRPTVAQKLTRLGAILGTPAYMAPEHAAGQAAEAKPASDQYSLGVVLYELLCGHPPFTGPVELVLFHAVETAPAPPSQRNPDIPEELERICLKAMSKQPGDRYPTCQELADDLRRWEETGCDPELERMLALPPPVRRPARSTPFLVASLTAGGLACVLVAVLVGLQFTRTTPPEGVARVSPKPVAVLPAPDHPKQPDPQQKPDVAVPPAKPAEPPWADLFAREMQRGEEALKKKDFAEAISIFEDTLCFLALDEIEQGLASFRLLDAQILQEEDRQEKARQLKNYETALAEGKKAAANKQWKDAQNALGEALKWEPVLVAEGLLKPEARQAEPLLQAVLGSIRQEECDTLVAEGNQALQNKKPDAALNLATKALDLGAADPKKALALLKEASSPVYQAAMTAKQFDKALALAKAVLLRDPADVQWDKKKKQAECDGLVAQGNQSFQKKKYDDAIALAIQALNVGAADWKTALTLLKQASEEAWKTAVKAKQFDKAMKLANAVLAWDGKDARWKKKVDEANQQGAKPGPSGGSQPGIPAVLLEVAPVPIPQETNRVQQLHTQAQILQTQGLFEDALVPLQEWARLVKTPAANQEVAQLQQKIPAACLQFKQVLSEAELFQQGRRFKEAAQLYQRAALLAPSHARRTQCLALAAACSGGR